MYSNTINPMFNILTCVECRHWNMRRMQTLGYTRNTDIGVSVGCRHWGYVLLQTSLSALVCAVSSHSAAMISDSSMSAALPSRQASDWLTVSVWLKGVTEWNRWLWWCGLKVSLSETGDWRCGLKVSLSETGDWRCGLKVTLSETGSYWLTLVRIAWGRQLTLWLFGFKKTLSLR